MSAWTPPPPGRHVYEYPRPAVAVDCVVLGLDTDDLKVLLIRRGVDPWKGAWALPGGFVGEREGLEASRTFAVSVSSVPGETGSR